MGVIQSYTQPCRLGLQRLHERVQALLAVLQRLLHVPAEHRRVHPIVAAQVDPFESKGFKLQVDPFESKGLKPGRHMLRSKGLKCMPDSV